MNLLKQQPHLDHANKPCISEIPRPSWAKVLYFSPKAAKRYAKHYQHDFPTQINHSLRGQSIAWGEKPPQQ